jgi:hypothetical protein
MWRKSRRLYIVLLVVKKFARRRKASRMWSFIRRGNQQAHYSLGPKRVPTTAVPPHMRFSTSHRLYKRTAREFRAKTKKRNAYFTIGTEISDLNHDSRRYSLHLQYTPPGEVEIETSCSVHEQSVRLSVCIHSIRFTTSTPTPTGRPPTNEMRKPY